MKKALIFLLLVASIGLTVEAKRVSTKRSGLKVKTEAVNQAGGMALTCDTLTNVLASQVAISGYDKALRSTNESFFVTNKLGTMLTAIQIRITYSDLKGRQLHSRTEWIRTDLPAGGTQYYSIRTFDRQTSFYFRRSQKPKRATGTPYDVKFEVLKAVTQ